IKNYALGVYVSGNYAYVADGGDGLYILHNDLITGVNDDKVNIPEAFSLKQNYPNPFNPTTTISYKLPKQSFVSLKVYDMLGRELAVLVNEEKPMGNYKVNFNASNLSSGIYFYRLTAGSFVETKRMVLLK
ncbi:MAG TPA: T9SS type A sorting domain-containing protein, partial [Ignavibacteria bacterium]|nr:T9SS type A sorting domain-containing protein [Ignavibacteria bacterium]